MELIDFTNAIIKSWKLILGATLSCSIAAFLATKTLPARYRSSIDVYVNRQPTIESENFYTYDGYYSTQASIQYTETVAGFFHSLQVINDAYTKIQSDPLYTKDKNEPENITMDISFLEKEIADKIRVKDIAPQVFSVEFSHKDRLKSEMWLKHLGDEVKVRVKELNKTGDNKFMIELISEPLVKEVEPSLVINLTAGFLAGLIIGTFGVFLIKYFKTAKN